LGYGETEHAGEEGADILALHAMLLVGIRYCGGCNPQIDRSGVITRLKEAIQKRDMAVDFTAERERSVDIVLLVNGCIHACLEEAYLKEGHTTRFISVKGEMVDSHYIKEDHIPDFLVDKIVNLYDSPSH
jgi:hypothetical protein